MPAGRPKGFRRSASMRINKLLWDVWLPKMAKKLNTTRTELIEETMLRKAVDMGVASEDEAFPPSDAE